MKNVSDITAEISRKLRKINFSFYDSLCSFCRMTETEENEERITACEKYIRAQTNGIFNEYFSNMLFTLIYGEVLIYKDRNRSGLNE